MGASFDPCATAYERYRRYHRNNDLFVWALLALTIVFVCFAAVALYLLLTNQLPTGGIAGAGTLASGAIGLFVRRQADTATGNEKSAYKDMIKQCGGGTKDSHKTVAPGESATGKILKSGKFMVRLRALFLLEPQEPAEEVAQESTIPPGTITLT